MRVILALLIVFVSAQLTSAYPLLQLDIGGGVYDNATETVTTAESEFNLYALLSDDAYQSGTFYISMAIVPKLEMSNPQPDFGTINFNGEGIDVTDNMTFGTPAIEGGFLPEHGVFETYFYEYAFTFDPTMTATPYNSMDDAGHGATAELNTGFLYQVYSVNIGNLEPGYGIHFDLYSKTIESRGRFAPFSHDAEGTDRGTNVPEQSTALLYAFGMILFAIPGVKKIRSCYVRR